MTDINYLEKRVAAFRSKMALQSIDVAIISHPKHVFYFTGINSVPSPTFLVIDAQKIIVIAPTQMGEFETITYKNYDIFQGWDEHASSRQALHQVLKRIKPRCKKMGFEGKHLPSIFYEELVENSVGLFDISMDLWDLRKIKDEVEIKQIEHNVSINDKVFEKISHKIQPGLKEIDLWGEIYKTMSELVGGNFLLEADLGGGKRGEDFGAQPTTSKLQLNDSVFIDIYSSWKGYYSDTTRVFVLGEPDEKQLSIHHILEEALAIGEGALHPGIRANQVDHAVRKFITDAGYGSFFPHHTGHAFGLFQQERPFIIPGENFCLEQGMVIAIEPGIYLPGWGGMRLEGNFVIEQSSSRRLDHFRSKLSVC